MFSFFSMSFGSADLVKGNFYRLGDAFPNFALLVLSKVCEFLLSLVRFLKYQAEEFTRKTTSSNFFKCFNRFRLRALSYNFYVLTKCVFCYKCNFNEHSSSILVNLESASGDITSSLTRNKDQGLLTPISKAE